MLKLNRRKVYVILIALAALLLVSVVAEMLYIKYTGTPVPSPEISRGEQTIGKGSPLRYVVMGDSTAISQGGTYSRGYATATADYLAGKYTVTWQNVAVSGARAHDIESTQVLEALTAEPDVVLIAVGANDVTHLTKVSSVIDSLGYTIDQLRQQNKAVKIILTGSPDMGSVPRFPQPVRWFAGERTKQLNDKISVLAREKNAHFAPIADKTGPVFRKHPELFAADKFHPTTDGYELWTPVIVRSLNEAGF